MAKPKLPRRGIPAEDAWMHRTPRTSFEAFLQEFVRKETPRQLWIPENDTGLIMLWWWWEWIEQELWTGVRLILVHTREEDDAEWHFYAVVKRYGDVLFGYKSSSPEQVLRRVNEALAELAPAGFMKQHRAAPSYWELHRSYPVWMADLLEPE